MEILRFLECLEIDRDPFEKVLWASGNLFWVSRACLVGNFRSWWWRSVSSPLQVSGAVTRLAVYRALLIGREALPAKFFTSSDYPRCESSTLQVSGAVTRLTVYHAAPHNLQRRGYYSGSNIQPWTSPKNSSAQFTEKFRWRFESRWNFHNSFSLWFQSPCSLGS